MSGDLRGFDYPLEPVRRQATWRLEALRAELGRVQREIECEEGNLAELRDRHAAQSRLVAEGAIARLDPAARGGLLGWLVELVRRIRQAEKALAALRARRTGVSEEYERQQRKVEAVERHREDCVAAYLLDAAAREANEADRDWLARLDVATAGDAGAPREETR